MALKYETDDRGKWQVTKGTNCEVRLLVKPSQAFLDWQAAHPSPELVPARHYFAELDTLKAELKEKGIL